MAEASFHKCNFKLSLFFWPQWQIFFVFSVKTKFFRKLKISYIFFYYTVLVFHFGQTWFALHESSTEKAFLQYCHPLILSLPVCQNVPDCFMKVARGWFCAGRAGISLNLCMILCAVDQTPVKWVLNHNIKTDIISKPVSYSLWSLALFTFRIFIVQAVSVCLCQRFFLCHEQWQDFLLNVHESLKILVLCCFKQHVDFIYFVIIIMPWEMLNF